MKPHANGPVSRSPRWDALAPPCLLVFFWVSDLLLPYMYAVSHQPWERQRDMTSVLRQEDMNWALLAAVVYLGCWIAGYFSARVTPRLTVALRERKRALPAFRLLLNFAMALGLFLALYALNPNTAFLSRMELTVGPWGKALFLSIGIVFAAFWLSAIGLLSASHKSARTIRMALTVSLSLAMIVAFAPLEGRGRMLIAVLYMIVAWHYFVRPVTVLQVWTVLGLGLGLALALDYFRLSAAYSHIDAAEMAYGLAYGRQFDGALNLAMTMRAVALGYVDFHHGAAWAADVMADLGVRIDHPDSRTMFMSEVMRIPRYQAGFPMTRPGELYLAFGWPGIALGAAAIGGCTRILYNWLIEARAFGAASPAIYFTILMTAGLVTQKNYLFSSLVMAMVHAVLIVLLAVTIYGYRLTLRRGARARQTEMHPAGGRYVSPR